MTEKQLQGAVVEYARLGGWLVCHTHDSRRSEPGYPDLCMVRDGRLVFAELKSAKGRTTTAQDDWLEALAEVGGCAEVYLWRPDDWSSGRIERCLRDLTPPTGGVTPASRNGKCGEVRLPNKFVPRLSAPSAISEKFEPVDGRNNRSSSQDLIPTVWSVSNPERSRPW